MDDGENISLRVMFGTVKAAVADDLGLSYEDISSITIPEYFYSGDGPEDYSIKVNDTAYRIPLSSEEIWNTVNYIYEVQHASLKDETRDFFSVNESWEWALFKETADQRIHGFEGVDTSEINVYREGMTLKFFGDLVCDYLGEERIKEVY